MPKTKCALLPTSCRFNLASVLPRSTAQCAPPTRNAPPHRSASRWATTTWESASRLLRSATHSLPARPSKTVRPTACARREAFAIAAGLVLTSLMSFPAMSVRPSANAPPQEVAIAMGSSALAPEDSQDASRTPNAPIASSAPSNFTSALRRPSLPLRRLAWFRSLIMIIFTDN